MHYESASEKQRYRAASACSREGLVGHAGLVLSRFRDRKSWLDDVEKSADDVDFVGAVQGESTCHHEAKTCDCVNTIIP
jgi:hypothetical protein